MNIQEAQTQIELAKDALLRASAALLPDVPTVRRVKAGESLQTALLSSDRLPIITEDGADFSGHYLFPSNTNIVFGAGSGITGTTDCAVRVQSGTHSVSCGGGYFRTGHPEIILIGDNETQKTLDQQPTDITFDGAFSEGHRGKRMFGVHGTRVTLQRIVCRDLSDPNQDSQAIYIGNAGGEIDILDCDLSAGSEVVLSGGDAVRTPGLHPKGIRIGRNRITRPLSWQTDGIVRRVKNLIEIKDGQDVRIFQNYLSGNWRDLKGGQDGYAIVLTPALDGAKASPALPSGLVTGVVVEDNTLVNVSSGFNILGKGYTCVTSQATDAIVRRNTLRISRKQFNDGGFGQFAKIGAEPASLIFTDNVVLMDGSSLFYLYAGDVLDTPDGVKRLGGKHAWFESRRNTTQYGSYGYNVFGNPNPAAIIWEQGVAVSYLNDNRYDGIVRSKTASVGGTFLGGAAFDALPEVVTLRAQA